MTVFGAANHQPPGPTQPSHPLWVGAVSTGDGFGTARDETMTSAYGTSFY